MLKALKQFWFVGLVAVLLIGAFGFVLYDENKDKVIGKSYDGQDVILTIGNENLTADMLYESITQDKDVLYNVLSFKFQGALLYQAVPITDEMRTAAKADINNYVISYFQNAYGENYSTYLSNWMKSFGFKKVEDIIDYTLPWLQARPAFAKEYFKAHLDEYWNEYSSKQNPRLISHILVKMVDPAKPTDEEKAKVKAVEDALKTEDFKAVAKRLSDDTNSAVNDGSIGVVSEMNKGQFVEEFSKVSMLLKEGETSEWVKTAYGWHMIKNLGTSKEKLIEEDTVYTQLSQLNNSAVDKALYQKAVDLGLNFYDDKTLEDRFKESMGVNK